MICEKSIFPTIPAQENEDFNCLIQAKFLERELLKWLRTSFDNDGKSIHDLK